MRAVSYERVSSEMQVDGFSLDVQHRANVALIEGRGWQFVGSYREEGASAKTTARPVFQRMLAEARAGRFDVIVVHKLDRLSRSLTDMMNIMRELESIKVSVVSTTEQFDFSTPSGRLMLGMLAALAEWYQRNLSAETIKGKQGRAQAGGWNGQVPFGYFVAFKKDGGDSVPYPDEREAEGVKSAFEWYATGEYSDADIAGLLNEGGWRPRGRGKRALSLWTKDSVTMLLTNRFYLGEVRYRGDWLPGQHEPVITESLFDRVQRARIKRHKAPGVSAPKKSLDYCLSGVARCARCGNPLRGYSSDPVRRYYRDPARDRATGCLQRVIPADEAEQRVGDALRTFTLPDDWRDQVLATLTKQSDGAADTERERRQLVEQLRRLGVRFELGDIDDQEYRQKREKLRGKLARLEPPPALGDFEQVAALLSDFGAIWDEATPGERRSIVRSLLEAVYLDRTPEGVTARVVPKPEFAPLFALDNKKPW